MPAGGVSAAACACSPDAWACPAAACEDSSHPLPSPSLLPLLSTGCLSTLEASARVPGMRTAAPLHSAGRPLPCPECHADPPPAPPLPLPLPPASPPLLLLMRLPPPRSACREARPNSRRWVPPHAKADCSSADTWSRRLPAASAASCSSPGSSSPGGSCERSSASRNRGAKLLLQAVGCKRRRDSKRTDARASCLGSCGSAAAAEVGPARGLSISSADWRCSISVSQLARACEKRPRSVGSWNAAVFVPFQAASESYMALPTPIITWSTELSQQVLPQLARPATTSGLCSMARSSAISQNQCEYWGEMPSQSGTEFPLREPGAGRFNAPPPWQASCKASTCLAGEVQQTTTALNAPLRNASGKWHALADQVGCDLRRRPPGGTATQRRLCGRLLPLQRLLLRRGGGHVHFAQRGQQGEVRGQLEGGGVLVEVQFLRAGRGWGGAEAARRVWVVEAPGPAWWTSLTGLSGAEQGKCERRLLQESSGIAPGPQPCPEAHTCAV